MMPVTMVGRAGELDELAGVWARVVAGTGAGGGPRTAIVSGPAGSGKSRLVEAALAAFDPAPGTVLFGRARVHSPAPYDWLAAVLSDHRGGELPVPAGALAWLAQRGGAGGARYAPGALLRLAVTVVRTLVRPGPAAIVVEDLHALDPASLNLIAELAAAPGLPALLLVTSRPPGESDSARLTERTLARLAGTPGAVRQYLGPLAAAHVGRLLEQVTGAPPSPAQVRSVHQRSGGNPYRLTELLATAPAQRVAPVPVAEVALRAAAGHLAAGLPETALRAVEVGLPDAADPVPLLRLGVAAATAAGRDADAARYA
ncbi:ATP-binding protein, partial [Rhizomonospora bruguierae]|uniref:ATP-binding protein n=1 Tax=Rhizomonospora bruguierae TaxID=1581705 RepID=UPI0020BE0AE0